MLAQPPAPSLYVDVSYWPPRLTRSPSALETDLAARTPRAQSSTPSVRQAAEYRRQPAGGGSPRLRSPSC